MKDLLGSSENQDENILAYKKLLQGFYRSGMCVWCIESNLNLEYMCIFAGGVITPSACKTIEKTSDGLTKSFQPNCQLPLGFICQKGSCRFTNLNEI